MSKLRLEGTTRSPLKGAKAVGAAHPDERLEVSIQVRRRDAAAFSLHMSKLNARKPYPRFNHEQFAAAFGAAETDISVVKGFAAQAGLTVIEADSARRIVKVSGTVRQFNAAFGVQLKMYEYPGGVYRGRTGALSLPKSLAGIVESVLGLDNRPQAQPHFRRRPVSAHPTSFTPNEVAALYGFPAGDGAGECVAIIELGGGYNPSDLRTYFAALKVGSPSVNTVSVDHAKNQPTGDADGPDGEVMLDVEDVGAIAPKAKIVVYFAPNTDAGFLDAITTAVHDTTNKPSIISISWGGPESAWTPQAMTSFDQAFQSAAALGITVCVASGDGGSSDGQTDGANHVDFPASSPHVLACGGTSITATGTTLSGEAVWNDGSQGGASGGGVSSFFALPSWQAKLKVKEGSATATALSMRGVPDVCGDADPETGYAVRVDGTNTVIGGTSAVAPLWAALIARINANTGITAGFINPTLYKNPKSLNDITSGNNGAFEATKGWDACSGLGSPNGAALAALL